MDERAFWLEVAGVLGALGEAQALPPAERAEIARRALLKAAALVRRRYTERSEEPTKTEVVPPRFIGSR